MYFQAPPFSSSQINWEVSELNNDYKSKYKEKAAYLLLFQISQVLVTEKQKKK